MMKKLYAVMAAALLLCGLLTACGSKTESANDVDLTGFYNALAEKYGLHAYDSLEKMLDAEEIDVLHICTPHYLHVPMIAQAHRRGIHVFTEKPPAISSEQRTELFAMASDGGARIGVCYRF